MADIREVFTILEESDGTGTTLVKKQPGDTVAGSNEVPVLPAEDSSGNFQHIPHRDEGEAADTNNIPVLPAKDSSGNLAYIPLDSNGKIPVSQDDPGTNLQSLGDSAAGIVGTAVIVSAVALANSEDYICSLGVAAATKATKWELIHDDNATLNVLETKISGPGDFNVKFELKSEFSSGATGTQRLLIRGTQLRGPVTDLYSSAKVLQKA